MEGRAKDRDDFDLSMFNYAGRDKAPAPVLEVPVVKDEGVPPVQPVESKEPKPFSWDFAAFQASLKEGISG